MIGSSDTCVNRNAKTKTKKMQVAFDSIKSFKQSYYICVQGKGVM
jgi:hypothetical protein